MLLCGDGRFELLAYRAAAAVRHLGDSGAVFEA
jgi:hypothetical protein